MTKKILIIEDNRDLARLLKSHLKDSAFQADLVFDGIAGMEKIGAGHYDLVILDLMLPGLDGMEICRRLRRKSSYVPILMLTAKSSETDRVVGSEREDGIGIFTDIDAQHDDAFGFEFLPCLFHGGQFKTARRAPCGPEVHNHHLAAVIAE